jgi:transcription elongation factor Elf1
MLAGLSLMPKHWFEIKATFRCPSCGKLSAETFYANSPTPDPKPVAEKITTVGMKCQKCGGILTTRIQVDLEVKPVTEAEAKSKVRRPDGSQV